MSDIFKFGALYWFTLPINNLWSAGIHYHKLVIVIVIASGQLISW